MATNQHKRIQCSAEQNETLSMLIYNFHTNAYRGTDGVPIMSKHGMNAFEDDFHMWKMWVIKGGERPDFYYLKRPY